MHLLTLEAEVPVIGGQPMLPGKPYYITNITAGMVLTDTRPIITPDGREVPLFRLAHLEDVAEKPFDSNADWNNRTIWLFRAGGWGDLLMMTPTIRALKRRWPQCKINVVCSRQYRSALEGLPVEWFAMPLCADDVKPGDAVVFYEGLIEHNPEAEEVHAVDLFAQKLGLEVDSYKLDWKVWASELAWAHRHHPRTIETFADYKPRVGIQVAASAPVRTYHPALTSRLVALLQESGYEVFLFGKNGQITCDLPGVVNLCNTEITMRQSVAVMASCDVMITPDSALFHIAQAIGVPVVALFGPFPAYLRTTTGPAIILEAEGECAPCFFHGDEKYQFPDGRPCELAKFCTVMASITPQQILEATKDALRLWPRNPDLPSSAVDGAIATSALIAQAMAG